ncbi:MAG: hypothetical protein PWR10_1542 [Halanaerobiales bacterium]|nr:hypothetical protein [Halanaerobiales bacterium]
MITLYKDYLVDLLKKLQLDKIYDDFDDLKRGRFPTPAAFIYVSDTEDIEDDGTIVGYIDDEPNKIRRYKKRKYKITNYIAILFVARNQSDAEKLKVDFFKLLDKSIKDSEGNPVLITPNDSKLHLDEGVLNNKFGRELLIEFEGGIYTERLFKLIDKFVPEGAEIQR